MKLKAENDNKPKYFRIYVEVECEQCRKRFVVPLDRFIEGRDFCSLHCSSMYSEDRKRLFFDCVEKTFQWRTHHEKDMLLKK
jgi:hypothetical protein